MCSQYLRSLSHPEKTLAMFKHALVLMVTWERTVFSHSYKWLMVLFAKMDVFVGEDRVDLQGGQL